MKCLIAGVLVAVPIVWAGGRAVAEREPVWSAPYWKRDATWVVVAGKWFVPWHDREQLDVSLPSSRYQRLPCAQVEALGDAVLYRDGRALIARGALDGQLRWVGHFYDRTKGGVRSLTPFRRVRPHPPGNAGIGIAEVGYRFELPGASAVCTSGRVAVGAGG